jgi:hypothetical protein
MAFVEVSRAAPASGGNGGTEAISEPDAEEEPAAPAVEPPSATAAEQPPTEESRKKFTKSYGS